MVWPNGQGPRWWADILIFDTIVRQVLIETRSEIDLWRIHRRANSKDKSGHQFTLLVYTSNNAGNRIDKLIQENRVLHVLSEANLLERYFVESAANDHDGLVEATSDSERWPLEIQRSWPYYIMGASEMVLRLIDQVKSNMEPVESAEDIDKLTDYYVQLNEGITTLWQEHGRHAYLHHLNALFGYAPVVIGETLMKF